MTGNSSTPGSVNGSNAAGGGVFVAGGSLTLTGDSFIDNKAVGGDGDKGAAGAAGANGLGGNGGNGGNGGSGSGGGLFVLSGSTTTLANNLIAENTTKAGTKGTFDGVAGGATGADVSGTVTSSDRDLIGDGSGSNLSTGDSGGDTVGTSLNPINPLLGPLQNNGGPTDTMALLVVNGKPSPAIDAGDSNAPGLPSTDQRSYARIVGKAVDIGAYEYGATPLTTNLTIAGSAPSNVGVGGQIEYTLTVTNNSSTAQSNVTLNDQLPADTSLVS